MSSLKPCIVVARRRLLETLSALGAVRARTLEVLEQSVQYRGVPREVEMIDAGIVSEPETEAAHAPPHPDRVVGDVLLVDVPGRG